ncbi:hypothetical protein ACE6H2_021365 [Prunus campanulata]
MLKLLSMFSELLKPEDHEDGLVPRTAECEELLEYLADACIPGDVVTVTGIMRVINNYMNAGGDASKGRIKNKFPTTTDLKLKLKSSRLSNH